MLTIAAYNNSHLHCSNIIIIVYSKLKYLPQEVILIVILFYLILGKVKQGNLLHLTSAETLTIEEPVSIPTITTNATCLNACFAEPFTLCSWVHFYSKHNFTPHSHAFRTGLVLQ